MSFLMPKVSAESVKMSFSEILSPALKPLLIALLIAPILFIHEFLGKTGELNWLQVYPEAYEYVQIMFARPEVNWLQVLLGVGFYSFAYVLISWFVILDAEERRRISKLIRLICLLGLICAGMTLMFITYIFFII